MGKSSNNSADSLKFEKDEKNDGMPTDIGYHQEEKTFEDKPY